MTVAVIDTGCANLFSVRAALDRLGVRHCVAADPDGTADASRLILPGVGAAAPAMARLTARGWSDALKAETRPLLGICLGMQLLFERSEEGETACLGLIPGAVRRLRREAGLVWPHMGWNRLDFAPGADLLLEGVTPGDRVYFVHGYCADSGAVTVATTRYGAVIPALVRRGAVAGCQFHPERSGSTGARILANFASAA